MALTHRELAQAVETLQLANSKAANFIGRNIRTPSLVQGTLYVLKQWSIKHIVNSDNPYMVVKYLGNGCEGPDGKPIYREQNQRIADMKEGDYYFFEAINKAEGGEPYCFGAYQFENVLSITSSAVRVTFFEVQDGVDINQPVAVQPQRVVKVERVVARKATRDTDGDIHVNYSDEDDGLGCPGAYECHPISMAPRKALRPST
jgi:hypothetical protein